MQLSTQVFGSYDLRDYQFLDKITRPFPGLSRCVVAGWGSLGKVISAGFRGWPVFPETRLDGLAKLPTIPPRHIPADAWCGKNNRMALLTVCRKDAGNGVEWTVWQEAKNR